MNVEHLKVTFFLVDLISTNRDLHVSCKQLNEGETLDQLHSRVWPLPKLAKNSYKMMVAIKGMWWDLSLDQRILKQEMRDILCGQKRGGWAYDSLAGWYPTHPIDAKAMFENEVGLVNLDFTPSELAVLSEYAKPKTPTLRPEACLKPEDFKHIDYMAAVRASCKGA